MTVKTNSYTLAIMGLLAAAAAALPATRSASAHENEVAIRAMAIRALSGQTAFQNTVSVNSRTGETPTRSHPRAMPTVTP